MDEKNRASTDLIRPWSVLLENLESAAIKFWSDRKYRNSIRLQTPSVWVNFKGIIGQIIKLLEHVELSPAEQFYLDVAPWLIEIGWQQPESSSFTLSKKYTLSAQLLSAKNFQTETLGISSWDPLSIKFLSNIIRGFGNISDKPQIVSYEPCGYNQAARIDLIIAILKLADIICYQDRVNPVYIREVKTFEKQDFRDIRFSVFPFISLAQIDQGHLRVYCSINPNDKELSRKLNHIFILPIFNWYEIYYEWMAKNFQFTLHLDEPNAELVELQDLISPKYEALSVFLHDYEILKVSPDVTNPKVLPLDRIKKDSIESNIFYNFDVHITKTYQILAVCADTEDSSSAQLDAKIGADLEAINETLNENIKNIKLIKAFGKMLLEKMLPGDVYVCFQRTLASAKAKGITKFRIRFNVEPEEFSSLPLEFINSQNLDYWSTNLDFAFSRYLNLSEPAPEVLNEKELRLLLIVANPNNQIEIETKDWVEAIKTAIYGHNVKNGRIVLCDVVDVATYENIRDALKSSKPHILQFVGHGKYIDKTGYLSIVSSTGDEELIADKDFARLVRGFDEKLRLVCLASCRSAQSVSPQIFLGIAPSMVEIGVPAVVAMQYDVRISVAKIFLENFYWAISDGYPVDLATNYGRNAILRNYGMGNRDFGTPVVYMRIHNGRLWNLIP